MRKVFSLELKKMIKIIRNILKRFNLNKTRLNSSSTGSKIDVFSEVKKLESEFNQVELLISRIKHHQNELIDSSTFDKAILFETIDPLVKITDCVIVKSYINDFNNESHSLINTCLINHDDEINIISTFINQDSKLTNRETILFELLSKIMCQSYTNIYRNKIKQSLLLNLYEAK